MCLNESMSHSKWNRNCNDGGGSVYSGLVHFVFVSEVTE